MATQQQIAELRLEINEPSNAAPFTDEFLGGLIDLHGEDEAGRIIWVGKRNRAATLVDISEGGSSRKNSQLFDQYDKIVKSYGEDDQPGGSRAPRTREIIR